MPKVSGKSTTPSGSDQENSEEACKDAEESDSSFAEKVVDSVLAEEDAIERKIKHTFNRNLAGKSV